MINLHFKHRFFRKIKLDKNFKKISDIFISFLKLIGNKIIDVVVLLILSIFIFSLSSNKIPSFFTNERTMEKIESNFKGNYEVKIKEIDLNSYGKNSLLVIANDRRYKEQCAIPFRDEEKMKDYNLPELDSPIIEVWDTIDNPLEKLNIFSLPYKKTFSFSISPNIGLWVYKTKVIDLDNDDQKEVIIEMIGSLCGSGSSDLHLIFGQKNGKFDLLESLPRVRFISEYVINQNINMEEIMDNINSEEDYNNVFDSFADETKIKNIYSNKEYTIQISHTDEYKNIEDIDNDGTYELIFAHPYCWGVESHSKSCQKNNECHWCEHTWIIGVYKYINGKYYIDNKWNKGSGLLYISPKKINLCDAHGYVEIPGNVVGFISQFYLEGSEDDSRNLYDPVWAYTRRNSEIEKIVKELYGK